MPKDRQGRIIDERTGDPIKLRSQLTPEARRIIEKHGGESFGGRVQITDDETGKVVFDNKDAYDMAKQYVALGGATYYSNLASHLEKERFEREYWLNELRLDVKCPSCNQNNKMPYSSAYMVFLRRPKTDPIYDEETDYRDFWFCEHCAATNKKLNLPEDKKERVIVLSKIEELLWSYTKEEREKYELKDKRYEAQ